MLTTIDRPGTEVDRAGMFHELLSTIGGALDIRDVFQRLSRVVAGMIVHDEADLALLTDEGTRFRMYASTQEREPESVCSREHSGLSNPSVPILFHDAFGRESGLRSGLRVPVRANGELIGVFALLSRRADAYTERDLELAQRVADYVAIAVSHQRLAETARRAALERDRAANLESSVELLRAIAGVLDIRTVFSRVSEIANKVLPHDRMTMSFDDGTGDIVMQARSNDDFPYIDRIKLDDRVDHGRADTDGVFIVSDLTNESLPIAEPADLHDRIVAAGYRSF